ncbi:MAG: Maf family protein [Jiangellaceae bacterium]
MTRLVLASASPGRLATLRRAGVEPLVQVSGVDEDFVLATAPGATEPADVALLLARAKAEAVAPTVEDAVVVGCDSVLELDGAVHGKPRDAAQATARWRAMRGRCGVLHSGHWVVDRRHAGGHAATGAVASTTVHFADVTDDEISAYVATGEPLQVAGGFTIDGLGGAFVEWIEGDHHNVVGLSLPLLRRLLADLGVRWTDLWS